jgi:2-polyprenyl-3-methyl-5-hydroxy-6-metoxy-1,4-benzoquinol methylase
MIPKNYYQNSRREMLQYIPVDARYFLDVGCGAGSFAASVKHHTCDSEVWGIEILETVAEEAGKKIDRVIISSAEDALAKLPDHYFDCVFFNDSLEHFIDPFSYLSAIRKKLKPGATVVASIPNIRHHKILADLLFRGDWRYTDAGVLDRTHLRFFTPKSMRRLFEDAGFRIMKQEGLKGSRKVKVRFWSWVTFGLLEDIRFSQFAVVAQLENS